MAVVPNIRPVVWIGGAKDDLVAFPREVVGAIGYALYEAQKGNKHPSAKPLYGIGGAGVSEVVEDHDGNTYRAIYTVRLPAAFMSCTSFRRSRKAGSRRRKP